MQKFISTFIVAVLASLWIAGYPQAGQVLVMFYWVVIGLLIPVLMFIVVVVLAAGDTGKARIKKSMPKKRKGWQYAVSAVIAGFFAWMGHVWLGGSLVLVMMLNMALAGLIHEREAE